MKYGHIIDEDKIIDEVIVSYFKEPKSYTTENMCEINSHGGVLIVKKILEICLKNGAKLAEPGEFTKKAFLNGRIDLIQAESVIDIINAKSEKEVKTGINQLEGFLSNKLKEIKEDILDVMVKIDVNIDYPEYDVEEIEKQEIHSMLLNVKEKLKKLEKSFDSGKILKEGIKTAIIGTPNAGKSSLLNAILREDRAIVTEYEGTTRDTIEEFVSINGIPLKLIDTAGIRNAKDEVEKIGIEKAKKIAQEADLIIAIFDGAKDWKKDDYLILNMVKGKKSLVLLNKIDIAKDIENKERVLRKYSNNVIKISALHKIGIEEISDYIKKLFEEEEINLDNEIIVTNIRQKNLIQQAIQNLSEAENTLLNNMPIDIIAIFINKMLENLGEITGDSPSEEIINEIFSKFCLGK